MVRLPPRQGCRGTPPVPPAGGRRIDFQGGNGVRTAKEDAALSYMRATVEALGSTPRPSASAAEARAATFLQDALGRLGLTPRVESFPSLPTFSLPYGILYALPLLAWGLARVWAPLGPLLASLAAVLFLLEVYGVGPLGHALRFWTSRNVWAELLPTAEPRHTVVLTAHMDSTRSALLFHPRLVKGLRRSFLLGAASFPTAALLLFFPDTRLYALLPAAVLALSALVLAHREIFMPYVPGANDNASGVAVLLACARSFLEDPLRHTRVMVVFTGSEESGLWGFSAFLSRHGQTLRDAAFVNVDNVGAGTLRFTEGEGMLLPLPTDRTLVRLAREVSGRHPALQAKPITYTTMSTDLLVGLVKGFRGLSVLATDADGLIPNWHWPTDVPSRVEDAALLRAWLFVEGLVRRVDTLPFSQLLNTP